MTSRPLKIAAALALALAGCSQDRATPDADGPAVAKGASPAVPAEPVGDPIDRLAGAEEDLAAGRYDAALAKVEPVLKRDPEDRAALLLKLHANREMGTRMVGRDRKGSVAPFLRSAEAARKLRGTHRDLRDAEAKAVAVALYNAACSLAIEGRADPAMAALQEAFDVGFDELATFEHDEELDSLRGRPDFRALAAKAGRETVAGLLKANKPFPFALDLPDLDGKPVTLEGLKGKVVIVDLWGTWCPPCREEVPVLAALHRKYRDRGLEVVGINCQEGPGPQAAEKVRAFLEENKVPYRCALSDEKVEAQVPDFEGFPTTLFLDRSGAVRLKIVGFEPGEKDVLERVAKVLLDEK